MPGEASPEVVTRSVNVNTQTHLPIGLTRRWGKKYTAVATCVKCERCRRVDGITGLCSQCTTAATRGAIKSKKTIVKIERRASDTCVPDFDSAAAHQAQMLSVFLKAHYPATYGNGTYLGMLATMDLSPIMSDAVNALCLSYLGQTYRDPKVTFAARTAYGRALGQVKHAVTPALRHLYVPSEVIASILIIRLYDNGDTPQHDHLAHAFGAAKYMESCGPSCLDPEKPLQLQLMRELHLQTLMPAVAFRQSVIWRKPGWELFERGDFLNTKQAPWWTTWCSSLSPLPGLLEKTDSLLSNFDVERRLQGLISLCVELDTYRESVLRWTVDGETVISTVDSLDADRFNLLLEEHAFMLGNQTFATHLVFPNPGFSFRSTIAWIFCLMADCSLLRILLNEPAVLDYLTIIVDQIEAKAFESAACLCRSIYYYSGTALMPSLLWMGVFLEVTQVFFEEHGASQEREWCRGCLAAVQAHIDRVRPHCRPTLCRVDELATPFSKAVRYRTAANT